ncbi:adenylosuccinate lyase [Massilicoli timonensis]|uniref:adenylosuccinate lyase n=2 Tax=Massilicoli timonensis TaxID=2015901 RepID=UPI00248BAC50|nr:adenylosuccinate lyase [Massilicoli timonensis]
MKMKQQYESPLSNRYASPYMLALFSADNRYQTWRRLWVSLAKAQSRLGLPISEAQVAALEAHICDIDYECVKQREKEVRHDVMAHVYAYGKAAPSAAGIIHLGATSCYVTDNADLIIYRDALRYLRKELLKVVANLADFAQTYKALPTLGYTHYQPAQLVTVGKRAALWLQDLMSDLEEIDFVLAHMRFLGCRGTTGTEASFVELFDGDHDKIDEMNRLIAHDFDFDQCYPICSQTYPRKLDSRILNCLSAIAQSCYKMANDIRLLQHDRQVEEPFEKNQIGSSAMAYKRNPMRTERICSLARYLIFDSNNAAITASTQWLERTLDDSANRRISMPEGFLCADAILRLAQNVTSRLHVNEKIIAKTVQEYLPFIATENLMMEAVKRGGDRQQIHEIIRTCSMRAVEEMRNGGTCDLLHFLSAEPQFGLSEAEMKELLKPDRYIGRCVEQVEHYLAQIKPYICDIDRTSAEITL